MSETTKEPLVRLPDEICSAADEAAASLRKMMEETDEGLGGTKNPTIYVSRETAEFAAQVCNWVLESPEVPEPATPPTPELDAVRRAVDDALRSHRLRGQTDDLGNGYPLVDALTPDGDASIERGQEELEALADHIVDALAAVARPAEARGEPQTPVWMLMDEVGACMPLLYPDEQSAKRAAESHSRSGKRWVPVKEFIPAAPRHEPGEPTDIEEVVDKAVEEADDTLPKGYKRFGKLWLHSFTRAILAAERGTP